MDGDDRRAAPVSDPRMEELAAPLADPRMEERLAEVLAQCSDRLNAGERLDVDRLLAEQPDLAEGLRVALDSMEVVESSIRAEEQPATIGDFRILREIGRGGMGIVYEAWQVSLDRRVCLKVLPPALIADAKALARFELETLVAGRLEHPGIVSIYGKGVEGGAPYYAMEFVDGETLDRVSEDVDPKRCLSLAEAFLSAAEALQYAHQKGVIHRDLKPSNLILDRKGRLRILDFGLARLEGHQGLTLSGDFLGTPLYMSPEQAAANRAGLDHRTDIYSLGATFFEALTGQPPFRGKDARDTMSQILSLDPPSPRRLNPRVPRSLETIVLKCLRKDPAGRYGTAEALAQDLRRFIRGDAIEARPETRLEKAIRRLKREKWKALLVMCAILLCITTAFLIRQGAAERRAANDRLYRDLVLKSVVDLTWPVARTGPEGPAAPLPADPPVRAGLFEVALAEASEIRGGALIEPVEEAVERLRKAIEVSGARPDAHYHLARAFHLKGLDQEAADELSRALEGDPAFVPALALRRAITERRGDGTLLASATPAEPIAADLQWGEAWIEAHRAAARRDWKAAVAASTALLRAEARGEGSFLGSSLEARLARGRALFEMDDLDGALEDFAAARALWRDLVEPSIFLGRTYYLKGRKDRAEEVFEEALDRPDSKNEVLLRVAGAYLRLADFEAGLRWAERAVESPVRERLRANLLASLGRGEDALRSARRAVDLDPRAARSRETLGYVLCAAGSLDAAEKELRAAIDLDRKFFLAHLSLAQVLEKLGKTEEGRAEYEEALRIDPRATPALKKLGNLLYRQGKIEEAATQYRLASQLDPRDARSRSALGEALRKLGRSREAVEEHRQALQIDPRRADLHNNLAIALKDLGDLEGAAAALEKAIELEPMSARRHNVLGKFLATVMRKPAGAIAEYRKAIAVEPGYWPVHYNLMLSLTETGESEKAEEAAERARAILASGPEESLRDPETRAAYIHVLDHLAKFAAKAGRIAAARQHVQKALEFQAPYVSRPEATARELNQYAAMLLECEPADLRDPRKALDPARRAVELSGRKDPEIIDTLAVALFETGDVQQAIDVESAAASLLVPGAKDKYSVALRRMIEGNLERFRGALEKRGAK
jgi:eukaryotic-like serine/threonine-protein kinase